MQRRSERRALIEEMCRENPHMVVEELRTLEQLAEGSSRQLLSFRDDSEAFLSEMSRILKDHQVLIRAQQKAERAERERLARDGGALWSSAKVEVAGRVPIWMRPGEESTVEPSVDLDQILAMATAQEDLDPFSDIRSIDDSDGAGVSVDVVAAIKAKYGLGNQGARFLDVLNAAHREKAFAEQKARSRTRLPRRGQVNSRSSWDVDFESSEEEEEISPMPRLAPTTRGHRYRLGGSERQMTAKEYALAGLTPHLDWGYDMVPTDPCCFSEPASEKGPETTELADLAAGEPLPWHRRPLDLEG